MFKLFNCTQTVLHNAIRTEFHSCVPKRCMQQHWFHFKPIKKPEGMMDIFSTKPVPKPEDLPKYEVIKDEKLWEYVERTLPQITVPPVPRCTYYPSGWKPQKINPNTPYFVRRSRNHMLPVYLIIKQRGMCRRTVIRHIHGDIHKMADDLFKFISKIHGHKLQCVKMNEVCGTILIHGDHVNNVKLWMEHRNF